MPGAQIKTNKCKGISRGKKHSARRSYFAFLPIVSVWGYTAINISETEQCKSRKIGDKSPFHIPATQSGVPRPESSGSFGEMQNLGSHPRPTEPESAL